MPAKIRTLGFLLRKQPYSESSLLLHAFTDTLGLASILAKGVQKGKKAQGFLLNLLGEYEFMLSSSPNSSLHVLTEFSTVSEYPTDLPLDTWFAAQAGAEVLTRLILPPEEVPAVYGALKHYLEYQKGVRCNAVAIFWRYLLHLYKLLGIPLSLKNCSRCHKDITAPSGYAADTGQPVCSACLKTGPIAVRFDAESVHLLKLLPVIGNYLDDVVIRPEDIRQLNRFLLDFYNRQFHQPLRLKSLQFFEQGLPAQPE